jgi:serine/threonine protein kinase
MHQSTGIYHRDLHTGNIMINLDDGRTCLIDFGMSAKSTFRSSSDQEIYIERAPASNKNYKMTKDKDFINTNRKKFLQFIAPQLKNLNN